MREGAKVRNKPSKPCPQSKKKPIAGLWSFSVTSSLKFSIFIHCALHDYPTDFRNQSLHDVFCSFPETARFRRPRFAQLDKRRPRGPSSLIASRIARRLDVRHGRCVERASLCRKWSMRMGSHLQSTTQTRDVGGDEGPACRRHRCGIAGLLVVLGLLLTVNGARAHAAPAALYKTIAESVMRTTETSAQAFNSHGCCADTGCATAIPAFDTKTLCNDPRPGLLKIFRPAEASVKRHSSSASCRHEGKPSWV